MEEDNSDSDMEDDEFLDRSKLSHCHCHLFEPSRELLSELSDGKPRRKYREYLFNRKKEREEAEELGKATYSEMGGEKKEKSDLKKELDKLRKMKKKKTDQEGNNKKKRRNDDLFAPSAVKKKRFIGLNL